ncbi:MAG: 50S ribosomal protein L11 methyltransferase [Chthoniobacterales bacterium]
MPRSSPKFIWHKSATTAWLREHELALHQATNGTHSLIERPHVARIRIECFCPNFANARELKKSFGGSLRELPEDFQAQWFRAHRTKPLRIGNRLTIVSEGRGPDPATLVIPASAAFGTGAHATTAMSLRLLERATRSNTSGWRMLDAGTGSGILALAARRFGAREVLALDHDPQAIKIAKWNARENGLRGVKFLVADVSRGLAGRFEIIAANLYSELLRQVLPQFRAHLVPEGWLILSGVLRSQEKALVQELRRAGFEIAEIRRRGKWIALRAGQKRG